MKYYIYKVSETGDILSQSNIGNKATDQTQALRLFRDSSSNYASLHKKEWAYTMVLWAPCRHEDLEYDMEYEYWIYDRKGKPVPFGDWGGEWRLGL